MDRDILLATNRVAHWRCGHRRADIKAPQRLQLLIVEGINVVKKHVKPNPLKGTTGGVVDKTMPIQQSNVALFNPATGKADRVGIKILADGKKVRVFKSNGEEVKA